MAINKLPVRDSAHRKEDISKRAFEEIIDPYFVQGWSTKDYGIDTIVDITTAADAAGNAQLESKCFLVQLKSTQKASLRNSRISFAVPVKKIGFWKAYNLPVLFVLYDIDRKIFYTEWIDNDLLHRLNSENANWSNQQTVRLQIPESQQLNKKNLDNIRDYVIRWKIPSRRVLPHGKYFGLQSEAISFLKDFKKLSSPFDFQLINEDIKKLETDIHQSIYKIAVTGQSRVGKSSLVNKLLKKEVSPTGFFQTTGVPIQVIPGESDSINLYFRNGKKQRLDFSLGRITEFASQEFNEDNIKGVQLISVSTRNEDLESGISLFDIPGLDDPDEDIQQYTWTTIHAVNAVIYVIDASPFGDGGYIFKSDYRKNIDSFSRSKDKVFLVFNKTDRLTSPVIQKLKERVNEDITKYKLNDIVGDKIYYLSTKKDVAKSKLDTIEQLRNDIWDYILAQNKSGIIKLSLQNQELFKSSKAVCEILNSRLLDSRKREQLENMMSTIKSKLPNFARDFGQREISSRAHLTKSLENQQHAALLSFETRLKNVPVDETLPASPQLRREIIASLNATIVQTNKEYIREVNELKNFIDRWIEDNLQQLKEMLSSKGQPKVIDFTEVESFETPQIDFSSAWGMGFIGMAAALAVAPAFAFAAGLIGFFGNLFTTAESRRYKHISRVMDASKEKYAVSFKKIRTAYEELMDDNMVYFKNYIDHKIRFYFNDIESQLAKFKNPVTAKERKQYEEAFKKIENFQERLSHFDAELRSFNFPQS